MTGKKAGGRVAPRAEPVTDGEAGRLFELLAPFRHLILAVSGGADSMALMYLASRWRTSGDTHDQRTFEVVTIDHGLRPESAAEARWVGQRARELGFRHKILVWREEKPATGIEAAGRAARYRLLGAHAESSKRRPVAVVTAHTEDDQAETLLMRLARGSGIDGLSCMAARRRLDESGDAELVRPLLGIGKRRLVATLQAAGMAWVEDPSNECLDFERARLRSAREELAAIGLTSDKLALSARRLARARDVVEQALESLVAAVDVHGGVYASVDRAIYAAAAPELRVRLLMRMLSAFGGEAKPPRLVQVEALMDALAAPGADLASTLGGCIVKASATSIRVYREAKPGALAEIELGPGEDAVWDGRFRVALASARMLNAAGVSKKVTVRALGARAYATVRGQIGRHAPVPARAAAALPSFWEGNKVIAVPQLNFSAAPADAGSNAKVLCSAIFVGWQARDEDVEGFRAPKSS